MHRAILHGYAYVFLYGLHGYAYVFVHVYVFMYRTNTCIEHRVLVHACARECACLRLRVHVRLRNAYRTNTCTERIHVQNKYTCIMNTCACVYVYRTNTCTERTHVNACACVCVCTCVCVRMCMRICVGVRAHVRVFVFACACACACWRVRAHVRVCACGLKRSCMFPSNIPKCPRCKCV